MSFRVMGLNTSARMCTYGELRDQQFTNVAIIIGSRKEMTGAAEPWEAPTELWHLGFSETLSEVRKWPG